MKCRIFMLGWARPGSNAGPAQIIEPKGQARFWWLIIYGRMLTAQGGAL